MSVKDADLSNANLNRAIIDFANLANADLSNANLNRAIIGHANLTNASLRHADLTQADLRGSYLTNASLHLADLDDSLFDCNSVKTANFTVNTTQVHIVDSNLDVVSNC